MRTHNLFRKRLRRLLKEGPPRLAAFSFIAMSRSCKSPTNLLARCWTRHFWGTGSRAIPCCNKRGIFFAYQGIFLRGIRDFCRFEQEISPRCLASYGLIPRPGTMVPVDRSATGLPAGVQIVGPHLEKRTTIAWLIEQEFGGLVPPPLSQEVQFARRIRPSPTHRWHGKDGGG